jgi:hypothetical protein
MNRQARVIAPPPGNAGPGMSAVTVHGGLTECEAAA